MSAPQPPTLLTIPRELRDQIIGELFFPGEKEPAGFTQDDLGLAPTAQRQIWPYDIDSRKKLPSNTAIIRTCRQLQQEAEEVLYGTSSWNLMYEDWCDPLKKSYEFFEKLPKRLRRLVRKVERKCYSEPYRSTISLFEWTAFMTLLAYECPNLHSLKLWGPGDTREGPAWVQTCREDKEWVQAILQNKSLRYFDIPVIAGGVIYDYPEFRDVFLPWLKGELVRPLRTVNRGELSDTSHQEASAAAIHGEYPKDLNEIDSCSSIAVGGHYNFRFLDLPRAVRDKIYRHALLPPNGRIHPTIKPWYDRTTLTLLPLLLTSKQIHSEAGALFFSSATFTAPLEKHLHGLRDFLTAHLSHPNAFPITRVRIAVGLLSGPHSHHHRAVREFLGDILTLLATQLRIRRLEYCFHHSKHVRVLNGSWPSLRQGGERWSACMSRRELLALARIPEVVVESPEGCELDPGPREWLSSGLRKAWLGETALLDEDLLWLREDRQEYLSRMELAEPVV